MDLSRDPLYHTIYNDLKRGIQITTENTCLASALIIIMATIDILASLDRAADHEEVTDDDFVRWVERYLIPNLPFGITGEEVYSARCAVLHMMGVESRRTRSGRARRIGFMQGGTMPGAYNPDVDPRLVLLNMDLFTTTLFRAIDQFIVDAFADRDRVPLIEARLRRMLMAMPYSAENME